MKQVVINPVGSLTTEFRQGLEAIYGDQLAGLILFGSHARGSAHPESDVDFAVVLKNPAIRVTAELFRLTPLSAELSLRYGVVVSVLPVSEQKLRLSGQGVYEAIRNEGIVV